MCIHKHTCATLIYKQWYNIKGLGVLFTNILKIACKNIHDHHLSTHIQKNTCVHILNSFFWIMRGWLKGFYFKLKNSWGNVLPINNLKVKWKISYFKVDSWLELQEGLSPTNPQDGKEGEKNIFKLHKPRKNYFWIVAVNSIMLGDSSDLSLSRLF